MSRGLVDDLLDALDEAKSVYFQACRLTINEHLGCDLPLCVGGCGKVLYPRGQWLAIPKPVRQKLSVWIRSTYAMDRCTPCYRDDVRKHEIDPVPRGRILPEDELNRLRRIHNANPRRNYDAEEDLP
jgi:hypothetical protein